MSEELEGDENTWLKEMKVGVEDAGTASVSIGTGWVVIKAFPPWLKEMKVPHLD